jgi:hypothetical protein
MGLDEDSGLYLTEVLFVSNLISWIWLRLYLYPFHVIASAHYHRGQVLWLTLTQTLILKVHPTVVSLSLSWDG